MRAAVTERLEAIPALAGRVHGAAKLADLTERGSAAQVAPAAFVLPLGLRAGTPDAVTGLFRQSLDRLVGVVLLVRNLGDATGEKALVDLDLLIEAVIQALAGWGPDDAFGVFALARGELFSIAAGTITYQLDFSIEDQLRIVRP
ncbi:phage tail terminator protein [Sphingomonas sp.]|jgi:hypothetical protein|uniref:phage tail terminator protein n=1 Tax=Sphingomonas sp. TaxID=28214 RepID=UPI002EDA5F40